MTALYDNKPIIICSTGGFQTTAIHLIRLSGFSDLNFLKNIFSVLPNKIRPRFAHYGALKDTQGKKLDDVVLTYFNAPNSYTGENTLELGVHGNPLNVKRILSLFVDHLDFRMAERGEFTYRALINQKLTLSQVEGLDLFLNGHNPLMLDQGLSLLNGSLDMLYQQLFKHFMELKSSVELAIDFSDDIGVEECDRRLISSLNSFDHVLQQLFKKTQNANSSLLSPFVSLYGPTNAGKSTFFNYLLSEQRSLVSDIEGTTRDYISESIVLDSGNYKLIDTAGLRRTQDSIESAGIAKALEILKESFFKIFVIGAHQIESFDYTQLAASPDLIVVSHVDHISNVDLKKIPITAPILLADLISCQYTGPIEPLTKSGPIEPLTKSGPIEPLTKTGPIEPLDKYIFSLISKKYLECSEGSPLLLERHVQLISAIYSKRLKSQSLELHDFSDLGVIDQEIRWLEADISNLVGVITPDQLLSHIFSNFCIGK